jgi:hypothetical protein
LFNANNRGISPSKELLKLEMNLYIGVLERQGGFKGGFERQVSDLVKEKESNKRDYHHKK